MVGYPDKSAWYTTNKRLEGKGSLTILFFFVTPLSPQETFFPRGEQAERMAEVGTAVRPTHRCELQHSLKALGHVSSKASKDMLTLPDVTFATLVTYLVATLNMNA